MRERTSVEEQSVCRVSATIVAPWVLCLVAVALSGASCSRSTTDAAVEIVSAAAQTPKSRAVAEKPRPKARKKGPMAPIVDDSALPRVLLIGDSISVGYTLPVREMLAGKANVHRIPTNGGPTTKGLENIEAWLGGGKWDVIHFNWGLHDLYHVDENRPRVPIGHYEKNLETLVGRLERTGAKLIWASTTPVPEGARARVADDAVPYNAVAKRVMKRKSIRINDLHARVLPELGKHQKPRNVHFTREGSRFLARKVADEILRALGGRK